METRLLIGGEQVAGDGDALAVENPATERRSSGSARPPRAARRRDRRRLARPCRAWAGTPAVERAELLHEVAARMRALTDELARVMTLEGGKPLIENSDEVGWTAAAFDYYAEMGRNFAGRVIPPIEATQLALVVKEPIGVWGCIVPWNYPLLLLGWKLAPALAAGNTVVAKPSELTPLSTLMLAECFDHLPAGAFNVVAGAGDVGARIVEDERVAGVAFTGSVETGKKVAGVCAQRVARINLEMGGKDPFIVCADVADDVAVAAKGGAWAAYLNAGQVCTSAERFYVAREVYDDFVSEFVDYTRSLRVGDPLDAGHGRRPDGLGPQRAKVEAQVEAAVAAGAELVVGGDRAGPSAATSSRPPSSRARRQPPTCCARRPSAPWRRSCRSSRSTRRSGSPTRRASASGRTSTRAISRPRCAACARSRRARSGSTTRSPTTTPARSAA